MGNARKTFRRIITSPEIIKKMNPENKKLIERFLKNFATKRSPTSVAVYRSNFNIFFTWNAIYNNDTFFCDIKKYEMMDFFDFCVVELQWGSARYAQMHSSLCSLSDWVEKIYDDKYPDFRNIVKRIDKLPKETSRKKSVFTKRELDGLMAWLGRKGLKQEQCLLSLMMASGARISELSRFKVSIIDENYTSFDGLFLETTEEIQVKGRGVNGKHISRYIIKDIFLPHLKKWLPEREKILQETGKKHDYLFIKSDGEPATTATFRRWMEKWDDVLDKHLYAHSIRHFWCTYLLGIGVERELVQALQDWSSDELVSLYCDSTAKDRDWKGLVKLRAALEHEALVNDLDVAEKEINAKQVTNKKKK